MGRTTVSPLQGSPGEARNVRLVIQGAYCKARCKARTSEVGTSGRMSVDRKIWALAAGALLLSALALGGCSSSIADLPLLGTPADPPEPPNAQAPSLPLHNFPPYP